MKDGADAALETATFIEPGRVTLAGVRIDGHTAYASDQLATEDGELPVEVDATFRLKADRRASPSGAA